MFFTKSWEESLQKNNKKLDELTQEFEDLNKSVESFLSEWGVTDEHIASFVQLKPEFTQNSWDKLNEERLKLEAKLKSNLSYIRDPIEAKKRYQERNVSPHWLFVR